MVRRLMLLALLCAAVPCHAGDKDPWTEVRSPNFIVISSVGDKHGRTVADQFETFRAVFAQIFPKARVDLGKPLIIFAVKNEKELKQLLPGYWEKKGQAHPAGLFVPGQEKLYVALRTDIEGEYPFSIIYHEYVHALMNLNVENLPVWLNEGLAELYSQAMFSNKEVTLGRPSSYHLILLNQEKLLPFETLLTADHDSPYYNEQNKVSVFYAQSWALTHFLLFDKASRENQSLVKFLEATAKGLSPLAAAQQVFGDLKALGKRFEVYIRQQSYSALKTKPNTIIDEKTFPARAISPAELLAQTGDFYVHTSRPAEAKAALDQALALDAKNALAHESYGVLHLRQQEWTEAAEWFEKAVSLDSKSFLAYYNAAVLVVQRGGFGAESDKAEAHLQRAIQLNPSFAPAYSTLASLYAMKEDKLPEAFQMARKAAELEPGVLTHRLNIANVLMRMKKVDEAIALGERVAAAAKDPGERGMAEMFLRNAREYKLSLARYEAAKKEEEAQIARFAAERAKYEEELANRAEAEAALRAAAKLKPGEVASYGTISQATCTAPAALQIKVLMATGLITLQAPKRDAVEYLIGPGRPLGFNPCEHLLGQQAQVIYKPSKVRTQLGELTRIEMLENPVVVGQKPAPTTPTAPAKRLSTGDKDPAQKLAPLPTGPPGFSEGKVSALTCEGTGLSLTIDLGGGFASKLHSANYFRVDFLAAPSITLPENFQPCTQLRGRTVEVRYVTVNDKPYDGEIISIQIQK